MTKYQEKRFKDYVRDIEGLRSDYIQIININNFPPNNETIKEINKSFADLKKTRIDFFNWFKKQLK